MNDFAIDYLDRIRWLLLVVGCAAAMIYGLAMKRRALRVFAVEHLLGTLAPDVSRARPIIKQTLLLGAMIAIILALIGPRWGLYWVEVQQRQLDLVICLDVSNSMLAEDAGMSRLARAKDDIKRLLDQLRGTMIGLVVFAGSSDLTCPLTDDYDFYRLALEDVGPHSVTKGGTDIGAAIAAAVKAFGDDCRQQRAIILMTDGEDQGAAAAKQARQAFEQGILVYTIGIGDDQRGALIPIEKDGQRTYVMHDGQQVWSKADPIKLTEIAQAGGGEYRPSGQISATQRTLEWIYTERLLPMEQRLQEQKQKQERYPRFHWPATAALLLLTIETLTGERRRVVPQGVAEGPEV